MKIGVSSYSFTKLVDSGKMNQLEVVDKAKEMGFDIIEFAGLKVPNGETEKTFAKKLHDECKKVGIEMGNYSIAADMLNGCDGDLDAEIKRLCSELEIACELGAPGMRHDAAWGFKKELHTKRGFNDALPRMIKGCAAVTREAEKLGIKTMIENHGTFCQQSDRVEAVINGVGSDNFGALVDIGNFLCAEEKPEHGVATLAPYMFHAHAKDFIFKDGILPDPGRGFFRTLSGNYLRGTIIGHGVVPVSQCLRLILESGYNGAISVEFEGIEDTLEGIGIGAENLRRYIAEIKLPENKK